VQTLANARGIGVQIRKPVPDDQPDIEWLRAALSMTPRPDTFAILRATSPFRTAATIRRAAAQFTAMGACGDSIRAVEPVTQTPYKMWTWEGDAQPMRPLLPGTNAAGVPWHSCPTQTCPPVWVQNACLEMGWTSNVEVHGTIHGRKVAPFFTEGYEGVDLNTEADWAYAEWLLMTGRVVL
jgi:N-acylneuraminate cytidylyltransferase